MVLLDAGYDVCRLAFLLADLPVHLVGRIRANRVMLAAAPPPGGPRRGGRPRRHGPVMALADPSTWPAATTRSLTDTPRYGMAQATAWNRMHPRLEHQGGWVQHPGQLPIVEGTVIGLQVEHLPGQREAKPVWLWSSHTSADTDEDCDQVTAEVIRCWQAYLRRFDLEHTIRLWKQTLGRTCPRLRWPQAADRWTWDRPLPPERLTPARVRRGFRHLGAKIPPVASPPKPSRAGTGRPPGATNRYRATRHDVGKTIKRDPDDRQRRG